MAQLALALALATTLISAKLATECERGIATGTIQKQKNIRKDTSVVKMLEAPSSVICG